MGDIPSRILKARGNNCVCCGYDLTVLWHHVRTNTNGKGETAMSNGAKARDGGHCLGSVPLCPNCHALIHQGNPYVKQREPSLYGGTDGWRNPNWVVISKWLKVKRDSIVLLMFSLVGSKIDFTKCPECRTFVTYQDDGLGGINACRNKAGKKVSLYWWLMEGYCRKGHFVMWSLHSCPANNGKVILKYNLYKKSTEGYLEGSDLLVHKVASIGRGELIEYRNFKREKQNG